MPIPYTHGLHPLSKDTFAYLQPPGTWGWNNCGLVVGREEALLFDTAYTLPLTQRLRHEINERVGGVPVTTVVASHGNGDHYNGLQEFPDTEIICSEATRSELHTEIPPSAMTAMTESSDPGSALGAYMRTYFSAFDWAGIESVAPTRTFTGELVIDVGGREVALVQAGPAHSDGDVFMYIPDVSTVFTGDLIFSGDHPVMWSGPWQGWVTACDVLIGTGASTVVPGHGPVTDIQGVRIFRDYLERVGEWAERQYARGIPYDVAAATVPLAGFEHWGLSERLVVTVGSIYADLGQPVPGGRETLIRQMAELWQQRSG